MFEVLTTAEITDPDIAVGKRRERKKCPTKGSESEIGISVCSFAVHGCHGSAAWHDGA